MSFTFKEFLHLEISPALGCTEPVAVALTAAAAAGLLPASGRVDRILVQVDGNVFKNGLAVIIPGTKGSKGLDLAAALGALAGDPGRSMQVLEGVSPAEVEKAAGLVNAGRVQVHLDPQSTGLLIKVEVISGEDTAEAVMQGAHGSLVSMRRNGHQVASPLLTDHQGQGERDVLHLEEWLRDQSASSLLHFIDQADREDLEFIEHGVRMNSELAAYGLAHAPGLGVGRALSELAEEGTLCRDMALEAKIMTAAAADARMAGVGLPAMSSAGSGNNGLTAILPIWAAGKFLDRPKTDLLRAIGLSHLITAYIKTHTGRLSAVCSCSLAAGAGAAAGLASVLTGREQAVTQAVSTVIEDLGGVLCDGAKAGCALKLATAAGSAVQAALLSTKNVAAPPEEGILGPTPELTAANLGRICREGMAQTGTTILNILRPD